MKIARSFVTAFLFLSFFQLSCKKDINNGFMGTGTITGMDIRNCAICCGGLLVNFEGFKNSFEGQFYMIQNTPAELGIDFSTATFPIEMKMDWIEQDICTGRVIKLTRFER